jgi:peptidoglycan hydrolase-like protein with peptidoglycan-binding domain
LVLGALALTALLSWADTSQSSPKSSTPSTTTHYKASLKHKKSHKSASSHQRGQQKIDSQRAKQIQEALIREHYLSGTPSGVWDSATQEAMERYQADNGWQSKTSPDARALIKLGLGPDNDHLLNPESAMTSQPVPHSVPSARTTPEPSTTTQPQR